MADNSATLTNDSALEVLKREPMGRLQWSIVLICIGILALDGYDVLSIAFAAPGLTAEWSISKSVLGVVLSLELVGMALGAIFIGSLTDSKGRRPTMLIGLITLTIGMAVAGMAPNIYVLGAARIFTGISIGGLLATATATSSDYCNDKNRALAVTLVAGGFAFGVYLGATFLSPLLKQYDWRITFYLGAFASLIFIPLVYFLVPETVSYLERKRPDGALTQVQGIMRRLGHDAPRALSVVEQQADCSSSTSDLFKPAFFLTTIILVIAYFGNLATYYYFVKWIPSIVTDMSYAASEATQVLGVISLGGVIGSIGMSVLSRFVSVKPLMVISLIGASIGVAIFPHYMDTLESMKTIGFMAGACMFAAIAGAFGLFVASFPSSLLGSGSGLVLGIGRGGAVLGPMVPGVLFSAGIALPIVAMIMASGSLIAGLSVCFLRRAES